MSFRPNRPWPPGTRERDFLISVVAVVVLAVALSACGSSSAGSTSEHAEVKTTKPVTSGSEANTKGSGESAELKSIIRLQIYGRWGGTPTEFEVAGGTCKIDKINTSKAALKAGGEAVLNHEHNASVLVTPLKRNGKSPTAAECHAAVAVAIG